MFTVPFSTPGPGWAIRHTSAFCSPAMYTPLPFSKPGPFVPARTTYSPVLSCSPAPQFHVSCDKVLPVDERSAPSFPSSGATTRMNRRNVSLSPIQGDDEQFLQSLAMSPNFSLNVADTLTSLDSVSSTVCLDSTTTENPSSPMPNVEPRSPEDRLTMATSPRGLTWDCPTSVMRWSSATGITRGGNPATFLSDIRPHKHSPGAFPQTLFPNASSSNSDADPGHNIHQPPWKMASAGRPARLPVTPQLSKRLPTGFLSDACTPDVLGSIVSLE
ncbi:hypothetical protein BC827DRAFT_333551 [Russula dissimulans]|nr:hypothetical protein BC827DRAFT_333551 [Russula dissimulans]